ncbi:MAG: DUF4132 domain-containing protein [Phycisphaerales bacterium]|nr:DUF4132 domain-containing protein [Phycisphaerales bacterium]
MPDTDDLIRQVFKRRKLRPWVEARVEGLQELPDRIRSIGCLLLGFSEKSRSLVGSDVAQRMQEHGLKQLMLLPEDALLSLGRALHPRFPDVFEAAWNLHERLPIQRCWTRRPPFRAPDRPDLHRRRRAEFLMSLAQVLGGHEEDLPWLAVHAPYVAPYRGATEIGLLLAAAIDCGGPRADEIRDLLRASAEGRHEIGQMGLHVTSAHLCSADRGSWEYIERLLLAAQRQEGLRQAILESVDLAHPDAFRHMLRVILDNRLVRFSATVRAADVWLGLRLDSQSAGYVHDTLETVAKYLDDEKLRAKAVGGNDPEKAFFALWSIGFHDGPAAVRHAATLLKHKKPDMRFMGVHMLGMLGLREAYEPLLGAIEDSDLRVAAYAATAAKAEIELRVHEEEAVEEEFDEDESPAQRRSPAWIRRVHRATPPVDSGGFFEKLARLHARLPARSQALKPLVWPWLTVDVVRQTAADAMIVARGDRPPAALLPYLHDMSAQSREWVAEILGLQPQIDAESRRTLLELVGDAAGKVREAAVSSMTRLKIADEDTAALEPFLNRKAGDLRRGVLALILSTSDTAVLASATRLVASKAAPMRLAGLDLLSQMLEKRRCVDRVREIAAGYRRGRTKPDRDEQLYLEKLLDAEPETHSLQDALGLMDPSKRTPPSAPRKLDVALLSPAAQQLINLLDAAVHEHRQEPVTVRAAGEPEPLGSIRYWFPVPLEADAEGGGWKKRPIDALPLKDVWLGVWEQRPAAARDADGLETARALLMCTLAEAAESRGVASWQAKVVKALFGKLEAARYPTVVEGVLKWLLALEAHAALATFYLDAFEELLAVTSPEELAVDSAWNYVHSRGLILGTQGLVTHVRRQAQFEKRWTTDHQRRWFGLLRWLEEPGAATPRDRMDWTDMQESFEAGVANEHDLIDSLLGPRPDSGPLLSSTNFYALGSATRELRRGTLSPRTSAVVRRVVDRILDVELARGESATPCSSAALHLEGPGGLDLLMRVLAAIGRDPKLQRNHSWGEKNLNKSTVFSHLLRSTEPGADDTPARFADAAKAAELDEDLLLAVALYAPQWAPHVGATVGWELFAEAVWWLHAHTKDSKWCVDRHIRDGWNAEIRKLTPLTLEDLVEGAVDVKWFERVYGALGAKRWARLDEFAKYASSSAGHKRAQLFAQAMLGRLKKADLIKEIESKRKQDAVRALGLLPLDKGSEKSDVLARYKVLQEFVRTCRQFGSQRQASEKLAARIGQENLARTAGYADPIRLQWAMESLATADLSQGPVTVKVKDVRVQLAINADGLPEMSIARGEKVLQSIPPEAKKSPAVQALGERKTELRRSASRMRQSLELAMCRGDRFGGDELGELLGNVILRPMLERLVFVGEGLIGYPVDGGRGLRDCAGKREPIKKSESLRLAHPVDLLATRQWSRWQRECFGAERIQPFKQVFRELYLLTEQEKSDATFSRRYAGQQVNPRQALALLGSRGWVTAPEVGVFRSFHDEKLVGWIEFMEPFYTPAEVEGLTLEVVRFARRGADEPMRLADVPPRLLSETLRDVDLIVSVAHRGGVDPEASASTVELRSSLLRETIRLLKLGNVKISEPHVHISGSRAEYSVHLGSATTHMLPGGALFIVPVHSQHRGRIFLPFADDDPKTAEILSKVLLLARDQEIQDPNLLDQIRARG